MPFLTSMCTRNTHDAQANMQAKTAHTNKVNKTKMSFYLGWFFKSNPRLHVFGTSLELSHGEMGWGSLVTSSHTGWLATNTVGFLCFLMEKSSLISELPYGEDPSSDNDPTSASSEIQTVVFAAFLLQAAKGGNSLLLHD